MRILRMIHSGNGGRVFQPVHRSLPVDTPAFLVDSSNGPPYVCLENSKPGTAPTVYAANRGLSRGFCSSSFSSSTGGPHDSWFPAPLLWDRPRRSPGGVAEPPITP